MDVPSLDGFDVFYFINLNLFFQLKPYVSVHTPWVEYEKRMEIKKLNDYNDEKVFGRFNKIEKVEEK